MKRILKEHTEKKVCGVYLKSKLLGIADRCENEDDAMGFRQSAEEIDESKQYIERITWEYFEAVEKFRELIGGSSPHEEDNQNH